MESSTQQGLNRTGLQMSPKDAKELLEAPTRYPPTAHGNESAIAAARLAYAAEAGPLGTIPPPGTAKGLLKSGLQMLTGNRPQVLIDKIAERLAYERAGVRLYDAYLVKLRAAAKDGGAGPIAIDEVARIQAEELAHAQMLAAALERLGADPTAQTPCADLVGVKGLGFVQALTEPRTSVAQATETILYVELGDNDSWGLLAQLARECGQQELAAQFEQALREEEDHLAHVRRWAQELTLSSVRMGSEAARLS